MSVSPPIACGLQEALGELWMKHELCDFTVQVENISFRAHRIILGASSDFFKALFNSGMKEDQESCAHISGMTKETFAAILKSVYTGVDNLTEENAIDIWYATHQLQMKYMMVHCENFVMDKLSVDNCLDTYHHAEHLKSEKVIAHCKKYILTNFDHVSKHSSFLELPFDDVYWIVQSQQLKTESEDFVIEFILKWVTYTNDLHSRATTSLERESLDDDPGGKSLNTSDGLNATTEKPASSYSPLAPENDRQRKSDVMHQHGSENHKDGEQPQSRSLFLNRLMEEARLCLASPSFLENLFRNELVRESSEVLDKVLAALMYQARVGRRHGAWPKAAIHRECSNMEHVMVFVASNKLMAYKLNHGSLHEYLTPPHDIGSGSYISIAVFDNILHLQYLSNRLLTFKMYNSTQKAWVDVINENMNIYNATLLLAHEKYIYAFNPNYGRPKRWLCLYGHATNNWLYCNEYPYVNYVVQSAVLFGQYIIYFYNSGLTGCLNTTTLKTWALDTLDGPHENIISFSDDQHSYLLQRNGSLHKIMETDSDKKVEFCFVSKLWDFDWQIYGGIFYRGVLFVFGNASHNKPVGESWKTSLPGVFEKIRAVHVISNTQCVPMIVDRNQLRQHLTS